MHVSGFMIPRDKVSTVTADDTLQAAMDKMLSKDIGSLVVMSNETTPVGIITSKDLVRAYHAGTSASSTKVSQILTNAELFAVRDTDSRDQAARSFEENKNHHAVVVNGNNEFVGLISAWDIAAECVRDDRAWPWIRKDDGKFH